MRDLRSLPDMLFTVGAAAFIGWGVVVLNNVTAIENGSDASFEARLSADTIACKSIALLRDYVAKSEQGLGYEVDALQRAGDCVLVNRGALRELEPSAEHIRLRTFGDGAWWYAKADTPVHRKLELSDYTLWDLLALVLCLIGFRAVARKGQSWLNAQLTSLRSRQQ